MTTTEEKARAYDKAVERIARILSKKGTVIGRYWLEKIFPELHKSEDERIREELIDFVAKIKDIAKSGRDAWAVRKEDIKMCERFLAYLEKQKKQNPAEWSEEDEKMMDATIQYIGNTIPADYDEKEITVEDCKDWLAKRVKSLRPRHITYALDAPLCYDNDMNPIYPPINHWKPSEEQMIALKRSIEYLSDYGVNDDDLVLGTLYDDLKKL